MINGSTIYCHSELTPGETLPYHNNHQTPTATVSQEEGNERQRAEMIEERSRRGCDQIAKTI
jgi:hypothetical protein